LLINHLYHFRHPPQSLLGVELVVQDLLHAHGPGDVDDKLLVIIEVGPQLGDELGGVRRGLVKRVAYIFELFLRGEPEVLTRVAIVIHERAVAILINVQELEVDLGDEGGLHVVRGGLDGLDLRLGEDVDPGELALRVPVLAGLRDRDTDDLEEL